MACFKLFASIPNLISTSAAPEPVRPEHSASAWRALPSERDGTKENAPVAGMWTDGNGIGTAAIRTAPVSSFAILDDGSGEQQQAPRDTGAIFTVRV